MQNPEQQSPEEKKTALAGVGLSMWIVIGMMIGAGIGVVFGNIAIGAGIGLSLGVLVGAAFDASAKSSPS